MLKKKLIGPLLFAVTIANFAVWSAVIAQPPGGGEEEGVIWAITTYWTASVSTTADVAATGTAAESSHAYVLLAQTTATPSVILQSADGTSSAGTPSSWSKTLPKPGTGWPVGDAYIVLVVDSEPEYWRPINFVAI